MFLGSFLTHGHEASRGLAFELAVKGLPIISLTTNRQGTNRSRLRTKRPDTSIKRVSFTSQNKFTNKGTNFLNTKSPER